MSVIYIYNNGFPVRNSQSPENILKGIRMRELSARTASFTDSVIRRMTRISNKYGAINLSQGFPDFDPPKAISDRLAEVSHDPRLQLFQGADHLLL